MRTTLLTLFLAVTTAEGAPPDTITPPSWTRARPLSENATLLLSMARERSSIVDALLQEIEQTDMVVYVADLAPPAVNAPLSHMVYLANDPGNRYLLVRIDHWRVSPSERIALLGHELQHVLEVARAPEVRDALGLKQLYKRIGWESQKDRFESEAAKAMGNRVRSELSQGGRRPTLVAKAPTP
jgi:hypothetical protein